MHSEPEPTAADRLPSTPAEALRWAASQLDGTYANNAAVQLYRWADELDAAPAGISASGRITPANVSTPVPVHATVNGVPAEPEVAPLFTTPPTTEETA